MSAPTKKQLAGYQTRRLKSMRKQLMAMSGEWEDLDEYCLKVLEELADLVNKTAADLAQD